MRFRHIVDADLFHAGFGDPTGDVIGHLRRIAIHRRIDDHDAVLALVAAPAIVQADHLARIGTPHQSVQRADRTDRIVAQFGERLLHHRAVLTDDVRIIAAHLVLVESEIGLVVVHPSVERPEHTERIARKKHAVGLVERHHRFGPVHPRRKHELQVVISERQRVAVLHLDQVVPFAEIGFQHPESFTVTDDFHIRVTLHQVFDLARMIEFHMVDDQVIERTPVERLGHPVRIRTVAAALDGIHQRALFVPNQVRIVGHSVGQWPDIFKKLFAAIVDARPINPFADALFTIHNLTLLFYLVRKRFVIQSAGSAPAFRPGKHNNPSSMQVLYPSGQRPNFILITFAKVKII